MKSTSSYRIEFHGDIQEGQELDEVKARLCTLFRTEDRGRIDRLFQNTPKVLKKNLKKEQAQKYQRAFEKTGACCRILEEQPEAGDISSPPSELKPSAPQKPAKANRIPPHSATRALTSQAKPAVHSKLGGRSLILFGGVFLLAGLITLGMAVKMTWNALQSYTIYQAGRCTIQAKELIVNDDSDGTTYRPHFEFTVRTYEGELYSASGYKVNTISSSGRKGEEDILERFEVGESYPCWYDPDQPSQAVLARGFPWMAALLALFSFPFLLVGGFVMVGGVRGGRTKNAAETSGRLSHDSSIQGFVPLKAQSDALYGALFIVLFWNGIVSVFVFVTIMLAIQKEPIALGLAVFLLPFVWIGLFFIKRAVQEISAARMAKHIGLALHGDLVVAGRQGTLRVSLADRIRIKKWRLTLVGKEKVSYTVGTDTHHEEHVFYNEEMMSLSERTIAKHKSLDKQVEFSILPDAMHSFKTDHNEIQWTFVVNMTARNKPDLEITFPFQVT